jgi:conjugal transfer pilus assembly protein TraB
LVIVSFLIVVVAILGFLLLKKPSSLNEETKPYHKAPIISGLDRVDPKELWVDKFSAEQDLNTKRMDNLEKMLESLIKLNQEQVPEKQDPGARNQEIIAQEIVSSSDVSNNNKHVVSQHNSNIKNPDSWHLDPGNLSPVIQAPVSRPHTKGLQMVSLNLINHKGGKALKTFDNTIPAGAFARVVLLGGVDASTSIQSSSDPRPVLLRITDSGTLPRKFKSDLCGCHALAACYGDISSERVFMRLEKVTCTERKTGEIVEMNVSGYVAGEDGRAGLRGRVVDKAGAVVRNAAIGGFLSGMGNFLSQSHNSPVTFAPVSGLAQTNPLTNGEILKHGASKGASNALEKYADFYTKRAEQMQPVIEVQAGRVADIVFTQGVEFQDSKARSAMVQVNDQQRYARVQ